MHLDVLRGQHASMKFSLYTSQHAMDIGYCPSSLHFASFNFYFTESSSIQLMRNLLYAALLSFSEVNECESSPCQRGSECMDGLNGYSCLCIAGFTGRNCEQGQH